MNLELRCRFVYPVSFRSSSDEDLYFKARDSMFEIKSPSAVNVRFYFDTLPTVLDSAGLDIPNVQFLRIVSKHEPICLQSNYWEEHCKTRARTY